MSESDNIEQAVDGALRSAVTQAAALGRMVAHMREQQQQRAARQEEAMTAQMRQRYDAERQYARVMLSQADHDGWWNTASTARMASVVATAQVWKDRDPDIAKLASRVDDRVQARWGITPSARIDELSPAQRQREAEQLIAVLAVDELDTDDPLHQHIAEIRDTASLVADQDQQEQGQVSQHHDTQPVESEADPRGQAPEVRPAQQDSGQVASASREHTLDEFEQLLRSNGMDEKTIEARLLPERANAKPAHEAAATPPRSRKSKGRTSPGMGQQRDTERGR